jgi:antitoxin CcdA
MQSQRRSTNLSLDSALLSEARALEINLSRAAEEGVRAAVAQARADRWRAENRAAIESSNAHVAAHGLPLERLRPF